MTQIMVIAARRSRLLLAPDDAFKQSDFAIRRSLAMAAKDVSKTSEPTKSVPSQTTAESVVAPLMELRHRMDDLFEDFMGGWRMPSLRHDPRRLDPFADFPLSPKLRGDFVDVKFDVSDSEDEIEISAELPGIDEKDVELALSDGVLSIKGEKKAESEEKKKDYYCKERRSGSFVRSFRVPDSVDQDKIKASFNKGVLEIKLPKHPEAKVEAKKIAISKKE